MKHINPGYVAPVILLLAIVTLVLPGCGNRYEEQLREAHKGVKANLTHLKTQLENRQLTNALLIEKYANTIISQKPNYADIAKLLKKEATAKGQAYTGLTKRLAAVNLVPTDAKMRTIICENCN